MLTTLLTTSDLHPARSPAPRQTATRHSAAGEDQSPHGPGELELGGCQDAVKLT